MPLQSSIPWRMQDIQCSSHEESKSPGGNSCNQYFHSRKSACPRRIDRTKSPPFRSTIPRRTRHGTTFGIRHLVAPFRLGMQ